MEGPLSGDPRGRAVGAAEDELADLTNLNAVYAKVQEKLNEAG